MPRVPGSVPAPSKPVYDAFLADLEASGRAEPLSADAARRFLVRWPDPGAWAAEPLGRRLRCDPHARPFVMFLMLHRCLRPGYDFLLRRKLPSVWRELPRSPMNPDLERFLAAAAELGFTRRTRLAIGSQVIIRLLIQTGEAARRADRGRLRRPGPGVPGTPA